ncbi:hypothetical protein BOX15_Mlig030094g1 [Macrostomum lignano]|uniref:TTL domain-containing protein n=1 Tax=Macrostomum lignano TaxID=282301 RepID=A0A267EPL7_9PLAT|nr:hypothetical protein BOX15_Mlig030094g1 [Macrostomum lignano]
MAQSSVASAAVASAPPIRQVDGVGFSLTGNVGKRERARIESTIESYIKQNYDSIRAQFNGSVSSVRLCINRSTNEITVVPAVPSSGVESTVGKAGSSGNGSGGGGGGGMKCIRRQKRLNSRSQTESSHEKVAESGNTAVSAVTASCDIDVGATADKSEETNVGGNVGESMDAAIEYLMSRDRRSSSVGAPGGGAVKPRILKSTIPALWTGNNILQVAAPRPARDSLTCPASREEVDRLVSDSYDCNARGAAFRQLFPTVRGEFFIFYDHGEIHCRKMMLAMGFLEKTENEERNQFRSCDQMALMWCNGAISATKRKTGLGFHIVNRLRFRGLITNKCSLVRTMAEFELGHPSLVPKGLEAATFLPATVHLNGAGAIDVLHKIRQRGLYLIKPGYSDCGKGIVLYRSDGSLSSLITSLATNYPGYTHKDLVLQKYIENPLLLEGKKFDLRVFLLVVPNQRRDTGVYAFVHPGYARLACRAYDINSDDLTLHLTNQAVQHRDRTYKNVKEATVWSPDSLNSYLNQHMAELKVPCTDWVRRRLYPRIRAILGHVTSIVSSSLCDEPFSYELFGCDFLVDADFNVWLLEVNSDPSLNKSTQVLRQIVSQVVEESVALAVEVLQRAARGLPVKGLATQQDFRKFLPNAFQTWTNYSSSRRRPKYTPSYKRAKQCKNDAFFGAKFLL